MAHINFLFLKKKTKQKTKPLTDFSIKRNCSSLSLVCLFVPANQIEIRKCNILFLHLCIRTPPFPARSPKYKERKEKGVILVIRSLSTPPPLYCTHTFFQPKTTPGPCTSLCQLFCLIFFLFFLFHVAPSLVFFVAIPSPDGIIWRFEYVIKQ